MRRQDFPVNTKFMSFKSKWWLFWMNYPHYSDLNIVESIYYESHIKSYQLWYCSYWKRTAGNLLKFRPINMNDWHSTAKYIRLQLLQSPNKPTTSSLMPLQTTKPQFSNQTCFFKGKLRANRPPWVTSFKTVSNMKSVLRVCRLSYLLSTCPGYKHRYGSH